MLNGLLQQVVYIITITNQKYYIAVLLSRQVKNAIGLFKVKVAHQGPFG